jgi:hypothetical protein
LVPTWEGELASDATIERRSIAPITVNRLVAVLEQVANALPLRDPLTILELAGTGYDPSQRLGERLARLSLLNLHPAGRAQLTGTGPLASLFRKLVRSPLVAEAMLAASGMESQFFFSTGPIASIDQHLLAQVPTIVGLLAVTDSVIERVRTQTRSGRPELQKTERLLPPPVQSVGSRARSRVDEAIALRTTISESLRALIDSTGSDAAAARATLQGYTTAWSRVVQKLSSDLVLEGPAKPPVLTRIRRPGAITSSLLLSAALVVTTGLLAPKRTRRRFLALDDRVFTEVVTPRLVTPPQRPTDPMPPTPTNRAEAEAVVNEFWEIVFAEGGVAINAQGLDVYVRAERRDGHRVFLVGDPSADRYALRSNVVYPGDLVAAKFLPGGAEGSGPSSPPLSIRDEPPPPPPPPPPSTSPSTSKIATKVIETKVVETEPDARGDFADKRKVIELAARYGEPVKFPHAKHERAETEVLGPDFDRYLGYVISDASFATRTPQEARGVATVLAVAAGDQKVRDALGSPAAPSGVVEDYYTGLRQLDSVTDDVYVDLALDESALAEYTKGATVRPGLLVASRTQVMPAEGITARITITPHSARDAGAVLARAGQPGGAVVFDRNAVYEVSESEVGAGGRRVIHLTELSPGRIKPEAPILAEPESVPAGRRVPSSRDTDDHRLAANSMPKLTNFTAVFGHGRGKRLESGTGVLREDQVGPLVKGAAGQAGLLAGCATTDLGEAIAETEQMDMLSTPGVLWFTTDGRATAREAEFDDDGTPVFREDLPKSCWILHRRPDPDSQRVLRGGEQRRFHPTEAQYKRLSNLGVRRLDLTDTDAPPSNDAFFTGLAQRAEAELRNVRREPTVGDARDYLATWLADHLKWEAKQPPEQQRFTRLLAELDAAQVIDDVRTPGRWTADLAALLPDLANAALGVRIAVVGDDADATVRELGESFLPTVRFVEVRDQDRVPYFLPAVSMRQVFGHDLIRVLNEELPLDLREPSVTLDPGSRPKQNVSFGFAPTSQHPHHRGQSIADILNGRD